ncbi:hypothetical protein EVAR_28661_1 [Eumeta japonica]|uniref:Uncharacterized protein n=1 Tax=Eumeta variegata TaxID=151549 RepID=A0A4C1V573_EUMVA|nr:hypothetical protein EVAR_28661_1 [Eumeta japonica]
MTRIKTHEYKNIHKVLASPKRACRLPPAPVRPLRDRWPIGADVLKNNKHSFCSKTGAGSVRILDFLYERRTKFPLFILKPSTLNQQTNLIKHKNNPIVILVIPKDNTGNLIKAQSERALHPRTAPRPPQPSTDVFFYGLMLHRREKDIASSLNIWHITLDQERF